MNIDAATAAIDILLTENPEFQAWWVEIGMDRRLTILSDVQLAIEQEVY